MAPSYYPTLIPGLYTEYSDVQENKIVEQVASRKRTFAPGRHSYVFIEKVGSYELGTDIYAPELATALVTLRSRIEPVYVRYQNNARYEMSSKYSIAFGEFCHYEPDITDSLTPADDMVAIVITPEYVARLIEEAVKWHNDNIEIITQSKNQSTVSFMDALSGRILYEHRVNLRVGARPFGGRIVKEKERVKRFLSSDERLSYE
jgi:hypothetical protein